MTRADIRQSDIISCSEAHTLAGLFQRRAALTPDGTAYRQYNRLRLLWEDFSWQQAARLAAIGAELMVVALTPDGNLGKARFLLRITAPKVRSEL